jgi:1-acyl-sn-glycerol-3-phosphate acyltransferase
MSRSVPRTALASVVMYLRLAFGFGGLGLICLFWTPLAQVLSLVLPPAPRHRLGRFAILIGFRGYLRYLSLIGVAKCDLSALDRLRDQDALILAPNHPSLLDAVMILSRFQNLTCIIKASLFDSVFFGAGARMAGYIRNDSLIGVVKDADAALKAGSHLLMFPEGTRTTERLLNPCKGGVALAAARAGVDVQTVIIESSSNFLGKGWSFFGGTDFPVRYRVRLGQRFPAPKEATTFNHQLDAYLRAELAAGQTDSTLKANPSDV